MISVLNVNHAAEKKNEVEGCRRAFWEDRRRGKSIAIWEAF
jgi:hypothetical protein